MTDRSTDQFFTMRAGPRQCAVDFQLYDEVIMQALQDHDALKINDM